MLDKVRKGKGRRGGRMGKKFGGGRVRRKRSRKGGWGVGKEEDGEFGYLT